MSTSILATKLFVPSPRLDLITRSHLVERIDAGRHRKLTLVCAPAGFGKTTLVTAWQFTSTRPVAWLALDEEDSDAGRFFTYFVAALRTIAPGMGEGVLKALQSAQSPPLDSLLTALLNELAAAPEAFVLVLDDYHVIDNQEVDDALSFLLDHLPPQMHLVITTREDPRLPLSRLRARSQLTEIRAADLRFTVDEAAAFFNQAVGSTLSAEDVAALEARTEGWIAGLQLAALALQGTHAMQGDDDVHDFVAAFAGDNRYVVDYLVDEVLARQPESVRAFLLQTSILERLSGPLCDAVTGQKDGSARLAALERDNLFVVPLDQRRHWFRYHHLFADVLRAHLHQEDPDQVPILHHRAGLWYEANEQPAAAIRHALAAQDDARAASLVERHWRAMDVSMESTMWRRWVEALPEAQVRARPVLSMGYGWALLSEGQLESAQRWLDVAEQVQETPPLVSDEAEFAKLPATVAAARAFLAQVHGDAERSAAYAQRALDLLPADDHAGRGVPNAVLGLIHWAHGKLDAAHRALTASMTEFRLSRNIVASISATYGLADIRMAQGRLSDALETYQQALPVALAQGEPSPRGTAEIYLGLALIQRERGDAQSAAENMERSLALGEAAALTDWPYRVRIAQSRLCEDTGNLDGALTWLAEAEAHFYPSPMPCLRPIAAQRARLWLRQNRLAATLDWVRNRKLSVDDELSYLCEHEHMVLARVLLAQAAEEGNHAPRRQALALLARLRHAAHEGGRMGSVLEIGILQALAHHAQGDAAVAQETLSEVLALAEAEGYVRIFVDEGQPMADLLRSAAKQKISPAYTAHLLTFFGDDTPAVTDQQQHRQQLLEPISDRELDVLRLLPTELTGPEIAQQLVISLNTLRTHTKNIYSKLGANNRRAAVLRAEELNLL